MNDFCVFILTHGRPDRLYTLKYLRACGYTGRIYIVIDNEDKTADEYYARYGQAVLMFDKAAIAKTFDEGDNFNDRRAIIYARNACFELAKKVGVTYFWELDDDYTTFAYKFDHRKFYRDRRINNLDKILEALLDYYKKGPFLSIAIGQGGDYFGGKKGTAASAIKTKRKCMNTFICSTERPFQFIGRINEDVNTYTNLANRGGLFLTILQVAITQRQTQSNQGGMTELYLDNGTFVKSFYTVMYSPSCTKISEMGKTHRRLHHKIEWDKAVPKIIRATHQKQPA